MKIGTGDRSALRFPGCERIGRGLPIILHPAFSDMRERLGVNLPQELQTRQRGPESRCGGAVAVLRLDDSSKFKRFSLRAPGKERERSSCKRVAKGPSARDVAANTILWAAGWGGDEL